MARVAAREMQGEGLAIVGMTVAVAIHFFQSRGDRPEVGGVDGDLELAHPSVNFIGAGQGEGGHELIGHIVADREGEGVLTGRGAVSVDDEEVGVSIGDIDILRLFASQGG